MKLEKCSGGEFLTMYLDKLWRENSDHWYLRGSDVPYIVSRPGDMSSEEFEALASLIGGGGEIIAAYLGREDEKNVSRLLRGGARKIGGAYSAPSRDRLISLAFAMGMDCSKTNDLLKTAGFDRLYPRDGRDAGIIFALNNGYSYEKWQAEIVPVCQKYDAASAEPIVYVGRLREYVEGRRQGTDRLTLDLTTGAGQTLNALRGGAEVLETWLRENSLAVCGRERVRFYLCRALLETIDSQIEEFLRRRRTMENRKQGDFIGGKRPAYDRTAAAALLPKLVFGSSRKTGRSLRFSVQTKNNFDSLTSESFDDYKINYTWLCREFIYFYGSDTMDEEFFGGYSARGVSSESLQRLFSGEKSPGRGGFMRLLLFFDSLASCSLSLARLDGMLCAGGFAGPDARNVDDRYLMQLMLCSDYAERLDFTGNFLTELEDEGLSYPKFRLLDSVSRAYPDVFGK